MAVLGATATDGRDFIVYNHSPSLPVGFYVRQDGPLTVGAIVTVRAVDVAAEEARRRDFADSSDRFIKRVAAMGGARVCGDGERITINGVVAAATIIPAPNGDDAGAAAERGENGPVHHKAPQRWRGCRVLAEDEILLLGDTPDSFDGRNWGPIKVSLIEGVWRKL